jgi:SAM-dependent methyltransferase
MEPSYFCDASYIDYFYKGMSPWYLDLVAALHQVPRPALDPGFTYCELGCGTGLSLVLHAAANPQGRFYGVDLNGEHIKRAEATARAGGLTNVTFLEEDFSNLLERDLPAFDQVALHGVYSWISPAIRREVLGFLGGRLKPGGLLYLSYNTLPGWAQQAPLRHFMHTAAGARGTTLERVEKGLTYLRMLSHAEAPILQALPQMRGEVDHILASDPRYVAHEYFTAQWEAFYFEQVAQELGRFGLNFVGCLPLARNFAEFCVPEKLRPHLGTQDSRRAFETQKDFILNTVFRRDVFRMGPAVNPDPAGRPLDPVVVGTCIAPRELQAQMKVGDYQAVAFQDSLFKPLTELLTHGPRPVAEFAAHPSLAGFSNQEISTALLCLLASDQAMPFSRHAAPAEDGLSPLNLHLLSRDLPALETLSLASPAAGTAITLSREDALLVWGLNEAGPDGAAAWVEGWCRVHGLQAPAVEILEGQVGLALERLPLELLGLERVLR